MLDTVVKYCPQKYLPASTTSTHILLDASYNALNCPTSMDCQIRYTLAWAFPAPTGTTVTPSGVCVAPPTPSPTQAPSPAPSPRGEDYTLAPTVVVGGGVAGSGGDGVNGSVGDAGVVTNYLSRAVRCAEDWANCTTLETKISFEKSDDAAAAGEGGCIKIMSVVGQVKKTNRVLFMFFKILGLGRGTGGGVEERRLLQVAAFLFHPQTEQTKGLFVRYVCVGTLRASWGW